MRRDEGLRTALGAFALSRVLVAVVAVLAAATVDPAASGLAAKSDVPALTHPFGATTLGHVADHLATPLARWDAVWYLAIAREGYAGGHDRFPFLPPKRRAAYFPAYPALVRAGAGFSRSGTALLLSALVVSLAAFLGALALLYRLAALEAGPNVARAAVWLLALSPMALFFSAPYSESLFLLVSVGALYAARRDRWAVAGLLAGVASGTRVTGILLVVPLALMYLFPRGRPRRPVRPDAAWILLAPAGLLAYMVHQHRALGDAWAWLNAGTTRGFDRRFAGPFSGLGQAVGDAWRSLGDLGHAGAVVSGLEVNLVGLAALGFAAVATVGVWRRLGAAYGSYVALGVLVPLSDPVKGQALTSLPRYATSLFPIFIWLAVVCERRGITDRVVAAFAVLLGLFTAQFATWQFVA